MNRRAILRTLLVVVIVGIVGFIGLTIYGNYFAPNPGQVKVPDAKDAAYEFSFKDSGAIFLASKYETYGTTPGKRTYILKAPYWNLVGMTFKEVKGNLTLSEEVFGVATIKTRVKPA